MDIHRILSKIFTIISLIELTKCNEELIDNCNEGIDLTANCFVSKHKSILPLESQITFWLFSPSSNPDSFRQVFIDDAKTHINSQYPIGFLIHGWNDGFRGGYLADYSQENEWMEETAREWANQQWTVIVVDWSHLAYDEYSISSKNTRTVGEFISKFIIANDLDPQSITLTGHSLGSHICGFAGQLLNGRIYQIIGLDPAGLLFTKPLDVGVANRLSAKDAFYVQNIHTACATEGTQLTIGHADFYVNGGVVQPGCLFGKDDAETECSHKRSYEYFKLSLNPKNTFYGVKCNNSNDCSAIESILSTIPTGGLSLENYLVSQSIDCKHPSEFALFGINGEKTIGSFDIQIQQSITPYV